MLLLVLSSLLASAAEPPPSAPPWVSARVWPDDPRDPPALAERFPDADPALGAHTGLHRVDLDGCWRQHAAHGTDLDLWFCASVKVTKKGSAKVRMDTLSDPRPGLSTCVETMLEQWAGPAGAPTKGRVCRAVRTHLSEHARAAWADDPWAQVGGPGALGDASIPVEVTVGRPKIEQARQLQVDPTRGDLVAEPAPVTLRDRSTTTARRLVTAQTAGIAQCWRDHASWRPPEPTDAAGAQLAFTLEVVVGDAGPERVRPGRTSPATHADVAACAAAVLDPELPEGPGSRVLDVPVMIGG